MKSLVASKIFSFVIRRTVARCLATMRNYNPIRIFVTISGFTNTSTVKVAAEQARHIKQAGRA